MANRYVYLHVLQGKWEGSPGWEDLCQSEDRKEMGSDLRTYRDNDKTGSFRIIQRREVKPNN